MNLWNTLNDWVENRSSSIKPLFISFWAVATVTLVGATCLESNEVVRTIEFFGATIFGGWAILDSIHIYQDLRAKKAARIPIE
jgi:hypothetical protein